MWRAVFAFALNDDTITPQELSLLNEYRAQMRFTPDQLKTLRQDFMYPQDVEAMYRSITLPEHKRRFCAMARALAWCDGDLDRQDERILRRVACLGQESETEHLFASRDAAELEDYYRLYARIDRIGGMATPSIVTIQA